MIEEDLAIHRAMEAAHPSISAFLTTAQEGFCCGGRIIYFGAGTSGRLAVLDASEAPPTFQVEPERVVGFIAGGDSSLRVSSEGKEDDSLGALPELRALNLKPEDCVIGVAAGGTTPYVRGGLEWAAALPSPPTTALITCSDVPKPIGVQHQIFLPTGPEVLTGSTRLKAGTATKMVLNIISTTLMIQEGRVYDNLMVDLKSSNEKLLDRAARIFSQITGIERNDAFARLSDAGGHLKTALVMFKKDVERELAGELLETYRFQDLMGD
jgi:N-acetylmuramic acid 6-phosphate etherase